MSGVAGGQCLELSGQFPCLQNQDETNDLAELSSADTSAGGRGEELKSREGVEVQTTCVNPGPCKQPSSP